ncbi:MAG: peptidoglycan-binding protein [Nanoarchaeota archaeon]|nr:peptidoglycan-binding protein [Nanoarchaeota archaeon]
MNLKKAGIEALIFASSLFPSAYADSHQIPPKFIEAVIQEESSGNPNSERYEKRINDTSYGLMQILTETAREVSEKHPELPSLDLNLDGETTREEIKTSLLNPETNKQYGTTILEENFERYGTLELAVAAYNAGPNTPRNALTQYELNKIYGTQLEIDGKIGALSRPIVKRFQREHGLRVDGIPGKNTRKKLDEIYTNKFPGKPLPTGLIPQNKRTPDHVRKVMNAYRNQ